jgi:hypothetical protein
MSSLSGLAQEIFDVLRERVPAPSSPAPKITYGDLIRKLPPAYSQLDPNGKLLREALGEIVNHCRERGWPALSALVVNLDKQEPGAGYFKAAHPDVAGDPVKASAAWAKELILVMGHTYPLGG